MSEPLVTPAAVGVATTGGLLLGMPVEAVALGAIASAAVLMNQEKKSIALIISYTVIGGLLGGAFAPILGHWFLEAFAPEHAFLTQKQPTVVHVVSPVLIGLLWQFAIKLYSAVYPSFESRFDDVVNAFLDWLLRRPKK
jgi:gluconate permease